MPTVFFKLQVKRISRVSYQEYKQQHENEQAPIQNKNTIF